MSNFFRSAFSRRSLLKILGIAMVPVGKAAAATLNLQATLDTPIGATSARIKVLANQAIKVYIEYGFTKGKYLYKSEVITTKTTGANYLTLTSLKANTKIFYRLRYALKTTSSFLSKPEATFMTTTIGSNATFAIQADPHMDENSDANVYTKTLQQVVAASPAFFIDLGDIFMVDKLQSKTEANIRARFELMKGFYKNLGTVPLKIVLGNHDGELGYSTFNTKKYRKEYFPEQTGELAYFAFDGPNQLHIALDPFTYTTTNPKDDGWQWTLGKVQYDWLVKTLSESKAQHKFIYIHHGSYGFDQYRPGWGKPIHQLLVDHKVSFVFKGHDHLYVKQELDGVIYQTLPQPSHPGEKLDVTQYGYLSGKGVGGSGFLKVRTEGATAYVDFVKFDGSIGDSYSKVVN